MYKSFLHYRDHSNLASEQCDLDITTDFYCSEQSTRQKVYPAPSEIRNYTTISTTPIHKLQSFKEIWRLALFRIKANIAIKKIKNHAILYGTELHGDESSIKREASILKDSKRRSSAIKELSKSDEKTFPVYLIFPNGCLLKIWNLLIASCIMYTATFVAYMLAFTNREYWDGWSILDVILDAVFFIDFAIMFLSVSKSLMGVMKLDFLRSSTSMPWNGCFLI